MTPSEIIEETLNLPLSEVEHIVAVLEAMVQDARMECD